MNPSHTPKPTPRPIPEPVDLTPMPAPPQIQPTPLTGLDARAVLAQFLVALFRWDGAKGMCSNVVCDVVRLLVERGFLKTGIFESASGPMLTEVGAALVEDHSPAPITGNERQLGDTTLLRKRYAGFYTPSLQSAKEERTALLALESATRTALRIPPGTFANPVDPEASEDLLKVISDAPREEAKSYEIGPWQGSNGGTYRIATRTFFMGSTKLLDTRSFPIAVIAEHDGNGMFQASVTFGSFRWTGKPRTTALEARLDADAKLVEWGFTLPKPEEEVLEGAVQASRHPSPASSKNVGDTNGIPAGSEGKAEPETQAKDPNAYSQALFNVTDEQLQAQLREAVSLERQHVASYLEDGWARRAQSLPEIALAIVNGQHVPGSDRAWRAMPATPSCTAGEPLTDRTAP